MADPITNGATVGDQDANMEDGIAPEVSAQPERASHSTSAHDSSRQSHRQT
jgi:hypothetical protein